VRRVGFHDGNGDGPIRTGREAHHEHSPAGDLLFGGGQQSCETGHWFGGCSFSSATRAPTTALGGAGWPLGYRRWFASRKRVEQIVGPGIRHDGGSQRKNHEYARRPKADDVVPVPVSCLAGKTPVEQQAGFQAAPLPTIRPPEIDSGDGEPEKGQVACAGDSLPRGPAFVFHSRQRCQSTISCMT
jgi:hypothetical protein